MLLFFVSWTLRRQTPFRAAFCRGSPGQYSCAGLFLPRARPGSCWASRGSGQPVWAAAPHTAPALARKGGHRDSLRAAPVGHKQAARPPWPRQRRHPRRPAPSPSASSIPTGRRVLGPAPGPEPRAQRGGSCHALPSWTVRPITARLLERPANQQLRHRPRAYLSGPGPGCPSGRARSCRSVRWQQLRSRLRRREPRPEPAGTRPALCPAPASENLRASASRLLPPVLPARRTREVPLLRFSLWRWFLLNESTAPGCVAWELPNAPLSTKACEKPTGAPVDGRFPSALPDSWEGLVSPLEEDCSAGWHNQQDTVSAQRRLSAARWSLLKNVVLFPASRWTGSSRDSLWAPDLLRCWSPPVSTRDLRLCAELRCAASPAAERLASAGEEAVWEGSADVWPVLAPRPSLLLSPTTNEKV